MGGTASQTRCLGPQGWTLKYEKQSQKQGQARKQEGRGSEKLRSKEARGKKGRTRKDEQDERFLSPTRESEKCPVQDSSYGMLRSWKESPMQVAASKVLISNCGDQPCSQTSRTQPIPLVLT